MSKLSGWIVSNGYLRTPKYMEIIDLYQSSALALGIHLEPIFNHELLFGIYEGQMILRGEKANLLPDFVLFLDKDIRLASQLEQMGMRLFNRSQVIDICDDKSRTFQALAGHGIKMPKTMIAPLIFRTCEETSNEYIEALEDELAYPIVIKESYGSFGEQVYLVKNRTELINKRKKLIHIPHIYQEFISSSSGRDVRINIVGKRIAASMLRRSETDFRANVTNGGSMENYEPSEAFKQLALRACTAVGADFAGVDMLFGKDEEPILCEINSNAHIKNIQLCTGVNVAEHILKHILKELKL